jgi:hypothetical protein
MVPPSSSSSSAAPKRQQQYKPLSLVVSEVMPQNADIEQWRPTASSRNNSPLNPSAFKEEKATCMMTAAAWISMALAVLSGASIGPMFKYMTGNGIPIVLAAAW